MKLIYACILILICSAVAHAQVPTYDMENLTVTDCDGILFDSGGEGGNYSEDQNLVFTINTGSPISLSFFNQFEIENLDTLRIFDGPDINSPLLGQVNGIVLPNPNNFTAASGQMTLQFVSDNSNNLMGFSAMWDTDAPDPVPSNPIPFTNVSCNATSVGYLFNSPGIICGSITAETSTLQGVGDIEITSAVNVNCIEGSQATYTFNLAEPLSANCTYTFTSDIQVLDVCDSVWNFTVSHQFVINTCGLNGTVESTEEELCTGSCAELTAMANSCFDISYTWDNGLPPNPGPHNVCPTETTTYTVTMTEGTTGATTSESVTITVIAPEITAPSTDFCQSLSAFDLEGMPAGGYWAGSGIFEEGFPLFEPDSAQTGANVVYYAVSETCFDSIVLNVTPIDAGFVDAACLGSPPFQLTPETPGGTWSGSDILPDGTFDPSMEGEFLVFYSLPNGCVDSTFVNVVPTINGTFDLGTLCQSVPADTLDFSPLGGIWAGDGIVDPEYGIFSAEDATPGTVNLSYTLNGCAQNFTVDVLEIYTGQRWRTTCPENSPFELFTAADGLAPLGGTWENLDVPAAILIASAGLYDPAIPLTSDATRNIYTAPNGCTDTIFMRSVQTTVGFDTTYVCTDLETFRLNRDNIGNDPGGGIWTGPGIIPLPDNEYDFSPTAAGVGQHWIFYAINNCIDSGLVVIHPADYQTPVFNLCSNAPAFVLDENLPELGIWTSDGIGFDSQMPNFFKPAIENPGLTTINWESPWGCTGTIEVNLEEFFQAEIIGLEDTYCSINTDIPVSFEPPEATLVAPSLVDGIFNPALAGEGIHTFMLTYNGTLCNSSVTQTVEVSAPITLDLQADDLEVCNGQGVNLNALVIGGVEGQDITYNWSNGFLSLPEQTVNPTEDIVISVSVDDSCSDSPTDSVSITVLPAITFELNYGDTVCFGEPSFVMAETTSVGNFTYQWNDTLSTDPMFDALAGDIVDFILTETDQNCSAEASIFVPSFPPLSANFNTNPAGECVPFDAGPIALIDLSANAVAGQWQIGESQFIPYNPNQSPTLNFQQAGVYDLALFVENIGGCQDSAFQSICILPDVPVFIPDIFSPNGDGNNDVLYVRGFGLSRIDFSLYDRYGQLVFRTKNLDEGWDGKRLGQRAPEGIYVYKFTTRLSNGEDYELVGDITLVR